MNKKSLTTGFVLGTFMLSIPVTAILETGIIKFNRLQAASTAGQKEPNWFFLSADDKYGKSFDPDSVKIVKKVTTQITMRVSAKI